MTSQTIDHHALLRALRQRDLTDPALGPHAMQRLAARCAARLSGIVYRRDSIDRLHVGEPHQLELWRICTSPQDGASLRRMIAIVLEAALPGRTRCHVRLAPASVSRPIRRTCSYGSRCGIRCAR